jgi:hypothetical protein
MKSKKYAVYKINKKKVERICIKCRKVLNYKNLFVYDGVNCLCILCGENFLIEEKRRLRRLISGINQSIKRIPDKEKVVQRLSCVKRL